jgi:hypothetical protein
MAPSTLERRRLPSLPVAVAVLAGLAVLAFAGWELGAQLQPAPPPPPAPPRPQSVTAGPLRASVPREWRRETAPAGSAAAAVGATSFTSTDLSAARAWLAWAPLESPTLLPAALSTKVDGALPAARAGKLAGRPAWRYADVPLVGGGSMTVTAAPTQTGVLLVGCETPKARVTPDCSGDVATVTGADAVAPAADLALRRSASTVLARLAKARATGARRLGRATRARGVARAARGLSRAHGRAAAAITPVGAKWKRLDRALRASSAAYGKLASTARARARGRYGTARKRVRAADRTLVDALRALGG